MWDTVRHLPGLEEMALESDACFVLVPLAEHNRKKYPTNDRLLIRSDCVSPAPQSEYVHNCLASPERRRKMFGSW